MLAVVVAAMAGAGALCAAPPAKEAGEVVRPVAKAQTVPVSHGGDAADDPAIWLHPSNPARSLLLGTDKRGGLDVYNLDGSRRETVSPRCRPNNVDILYGFGLGGRRVDLAVATVRAGDARGVKVWAIDATGRLADATAGGTLGVFGGKTPYGVCCYRDVKTGKGYFFVVGKSGAIEQHALRDAGGGRVTSACVRRLKVGSIAEGCVADDELGWLYVAEEGVGIWKFAAAADGPAKGRLIAKVGEHGLTADVEGLTIYYASGGKGYLIASSQGSNTFCVYAREGDNRYLLTVDPQAGPIDDVNDTDGVAVTNRPTSRQFPAGVLVVQDGHNSGGNQNFKLYDWRDVAGRRLRVDPAFRRPGRGRKGPPPR